VPKPGAAIYQSQADPKTRPVILPVFFWEPGGAHPAPDPVVMVASNCDQLEVFVGGLHVTSAQPAFDSPMYSGLIHPPFLIRLPTFPVGRETPELLIRGYVDGVQVTELRMSADASGDTLSMTADDAAIWADGSDATRVVFRAIDAHGNQRRFRVGQVAFTLSGPATLVGDNPFDFGRYGGLGAAWLRSMAGQAGTITLTANHPQLGQAEIQIRSEQAGQPDQLA
jgi:beta-galactosidase